MKVKVASLVSTNVSKSAKLDPLLEETVDLLVKRFPKNSSWVTTAKRSKDSDSYTFSFDEQHYISVELNSVKNTVCIDCALYLGGFPNSVHLGTSETTSAEKAVNEFLIKYKKSNKKLQERIEVLKGMIL